MGEVIGNYNSVEIEKGILEFWKTNKTYNKIKAKAKGSKPFYFLDGPPYTSGRTHLGIAWNKSLKDSVLRYKRMRGFDVWDRAGYDMHGLPTEHKVMEKLGMKDKEEIPRLGVSKFIEECKKLSIENMNLMSDDFLRLGVWMDFENPYQSIKNEFIEGEWWLVKKAYENNRLYEGEKVMHWCPKCGTSLAKHELEYKNVKEDSIFLKFRVKGRLGDKGDKKERSSEKKRDDKKKDREKEDRGTEEGEKKEYLIVWTTTPWTIAYNLGVMVNPEEDYVRAEVENEIWVVAKKLANLFISSLDKGFSIIEEFKGRRLEGIEYEHPFNGELNELYAKLKKKSKNVHTVLLSAEYVDTGSGTGLVHCAPGCGPEDYEVGHKYKIPPFNALEENGKYGREMGRFAGWDAKEDNRRFIGELDKKGALLAERAVEHEYAHCWRCKSPVVFRATKQWFFRVEDLKEKMRELNRNVLWVPDWAGSSWFDSWIDNLRDNGITRQRYWGTPLPIWRCGKCREYVVVGSISELKKLAKDIPNDLHLPYIDKVVIKCSCGGVMKRIPDVLDVWIDAGTASWTCLDYPQKDAMFKKLWPPELILEGKDQIRGWFNLLLVASMVSMGRHSYKRCYMHGFVQDAEGRKMSKSLGNIISPYEVIDKSGADTLRYYMIGGANPGLDINYNPEDTKVKHKNLTVLWNLHNYLIDLVKSSNLGVNPNVNLNVNLNVKKLNVKKLKMDRKRFSIAERYIISKLNSAIKKATELFEQYRLNEVPWIIEELYLELSRTYIQLSRERASVGSREDKEVVISVVYYVLFEVLKLAAPIIPFITERMYLNLKDVFSLEGESIHLHKWPEYIEEDIDNELERNVSIAQDVVQSILAGREKISLGIRWPLKEVIITSKDKQVVEALEKLESLIKTGANVREVRIQESLPGIELSVKADFARLGPDFGKLSPKIVAKIIMESPQSILRHLEKEGKFAVELEGTQLNIVKEHLIIRRSVPEPYYEVEFRGGFLYISKEMDKELELEGFAREIMRRVQSLRKKAGLEKKDRIELFIRTELDLRKFESQLIEKVGASLLTISESGPKVEFESSSEEKVKGRTIGIFLKRG